MIRKFIILSTFFLGLASSLQAREWDGRLLESSQKVYQGNGAQALSLINQYIAENPLDPNALFVKAVILEWKTALEGKNPDSVQGEVLKIYEQASDMAYQLWHQDPENVDRLIDVGNGFLFLGRKYADVRSNLKAVLTAKKSQKYFDAALKKDPNRTEGLLALGGFHYLAGTTSASLAPFKVLLGIKGSKEEGLSEMKKSLTGNHPFVNDTLYALIFINMEHEKNYEEAFRYQGEMEKKFPDNPELKYKKGIISEKQDKTKGANAFVEFSKWCEAHSDKCHKTYLFSAYYNAGRLYKDVGDKSKAKENFAKAIMNNTNVYPQLAAEALYWPGLIEESEGQVQLAVEKYKKAKEMPGVSRNMKKEIEDKLGRICKPDNTQVKC